MTTHNSSSNGQNSGRHLSDNNYTGSFATESKMPWYPDVVPLGTSPEFERLVENAIITAERSKAVGTDEIFVKVLQLDPRLSSKLHCQIWEDVA